MHGGAYQRPGLPDILIVKNKKHIWVEFKKANGIISGAQYAVAKELHREGVEVHLVILEEDWGYGTKIIKKKLFKEMVRELLTLLESA